MNTNFNDPTEFAKALRNIDATNEPEAIRRMIDKDQDAELMHSKAGNYFQVVNGELKKVES